MATVNYNDGLLVRLQSPEYAIEYLNEALDEGSQEVFMMALRDVAKAKGISQIAKETNLNRESMYRMLSEKGNPNLSSLHQILNSLGLTLAIEKKKTLLEYQLCTNSGDSLNSWNSWGRIPISIIKMHTDKPEILSLAEKGRTCIV